MDAPEDRSKALIVRFCPNSRHRCCVPARLLRATSGLMHRSKRRRYSICSSAISNRLKGHVDVERACRRQIDAQGEPGRKLDRQVAHRRAPQDAIDVDARQPELFLECCVFPAENQPIVKTMRKRALPDIIFA